MSPIYFRPTDASGGHHAGPPAGGHDASALSHGALSAKMFSGAEVSAVGTAAVAPVGMEHAMLAPIAGANEPISPLIQLIMRMPGQIGLASSFFEALGNFLLPHLHALGLDPTILNLHAHVATQLNHASLLPSSEHMAIDPSLLAQDGSAFQSLGHGATFDALHRDVYMPRCDAVASSSPLKMSGTVDLSKPQFDGPRGPIGPGGGGEQLSGPSMSESPVSTHLAGSHRIYSDRFQGSFFTKPGMKAAFSAGNSSGLFQSAPSTTTPTAVPSSLNTDASNLMAQQSAPQTVAQSDAAAGSAGIQTGNGGLGNGGLENTTSSSLGPSGAVSDQLGASKQLLALNHADSFRPSSGAVQPVGSDYGASYLQSQPSTDAAAAHHANPAQSITKGLKAKELSLDSLKPGAASAPHKVMDHIGHQFKSGMNDGGRAMDHVAHKSTPHSLAHRPAVNSPSGNTSHQIASSVKPAASAQPSDTVSGAGNDAAIDSGADSTVAQPTDNPATATDSVPSTYTIRSGDCLWNIAKDHLGSGLRWQEIYKINQDVLGTNPDLIYSGTELKLPGIGNDLAHAGGHASEYVVKSGDCLWNIAKDQLGDATKWSDLYKANADVISNPSLIFPGQHLAVPGHDSAALAEAGTAAGAPVEQVADAASQSGSAAGSAAGSVPSADNGSFSSQGTMDSATSTPVQGADMQGGMQQPAPVQQPAPLQPAPIQPTPTTIPGAVGPGAAIPASPAAMSLGPGAAGAATLHVQPLNGADVMQPTQSTVVNSSIGADLASFLSKRK